ILFSFMDFQSIFSFPAYGSFAAMLSYLPQVFYLILSICRPVFKASNTRGSCQLVLGFALLSAPLFGQGSYSKSIISYRSKCPCQQSYFSLFSSVMLCISSLEASLYTFVAL